MREMAVGMREHAAASPSVSVMVRCVSLVTREFERVDGMETTAATDEGQGPSSGRSCIGDRAGFTRRRARGSCRAAHEAATCSLAGMKPGPETCAVNVADPATDKSQAG